MASAVAILLLSKVSIHSVILLPLQRVPRPHCKAEGVWRGCWALLSGMATQRECKTWGTLWFPHLAYWLDPCTAGPGRAARRVGRQWFALAHGPTLPLSKRVSACSYAGRASHCSSTRLYWCSFYHCPYPKHSYINILVNTVTLWGLGNNLALDPIPWKLALISSGRRQTWKLQILSATPNLF